MAKRLVLATDKFKRHITDSERLAFISAYLRTGTLVTSAATIRESPLHRCLPRLDRQACRTCPSARIADTIKDNALSTGVLPS